MTTKTEKTAKGNGDETKSHCGTNQDGPTIGGTLTGTGGAGVARKRSHVAGMGASAANPQGGRMGAVAADTGRDPDPGPDPGGIVTENFEGEVISFTAAGAFVNATAMSAAFGKRPVDFLRLPTAKAFLEALSEETGADAGKLVITRRGGDQKSKCENLTLISGTWFHPDLALECARWLSPRFAIWTNRVIRRILAGEALPAAPALSLECGLESVIVAQYKGIPVAIQAGTGFVNFSRVLKPSCWLRTARAKDFIASLSRETGIPAGELLSRKRGPVFSGTWLHPVLALDCARWFSADFSFWLEKVIRRVSAGNEGRAK